MASRSLTVCVQAKWLERTSVRTELRKYLVSLVSSSVMAEPSSSMNCLQMAFRFDS